MLEKGKATVYYVLECLKQYRDLFAVDDIVLVQLSSERLFNTIPPPLVI